jgi:hypothetical protein
MPSVTSIGTGSWSSLPDRDTMNATLAQHWWTIVLRGVIAVLFGIFALAAPGAVLLADGLIGLAGIVRAVRAHRHWGALLAEAVLNILVRLVALIIPGAAVFGLRAPDGGLGIDVRRPHAVGGASATCQPWTVVAGVRRRRVADLGCDARRGATDRRGGAGVVAGDLRRRLRHLVASLRVAVARPADGLALCRKPRLFVWHQTPLPDALNALNVISV